MPQFDFNELVSYLRETEGDALRWVADFNTKSFSYKFHHIRADLKNDLTGNQLDHVIHRSLAVYNKRHAEEVYFHLGEAGYLIVEYDRGIALHLFLNDIRGVTIMLESDRSIELPTFIEECRTRVEPS